MHKRNIPLLASAVLAFTFVSPVILTAQESSMDTTIQAGFECAAFQNVGTSDTLRTAESVSFEITARRGNTLIIDAAIESDFSGEPLIADKVIKELSLSWSPASFAVLTVGKQKLKWGTARIFSSIDSLTPPIDPRDPAGSNRGVTGICADIIPSWWLSFSALALPAPILGETRAALRCEMLLGETDVSLGAIRTVNIDGKEEPVFIADAAHFFDHFGMYAETQLIKKTHWEPSVTTGLQIDISAWLNGTITFLGEYRYLHEKIQVNHMFYTGFMGIPVTRKVAATISVLAAPEKEQLLFATSLDWKISQSMSAYTTYEYLHDSQTEETDHTSVFTGYRNYFSVGITAVY